MKYATVLHEYCRRHNAIAEPVDNWGYLVRDRALLFYSSSTPAEIHNAFEYPPVRVPTIAYCDGSGTTMDKPAGIGVVLYIARDNPVYIAENIGRGTNNVAELRAIWRALRAFPDLGRKVLVCSDSEYAIGSLTKPWNATANAELIRCIRYDLSLRGDCIKFQHVDGHSGIEGNEIADQLANIGRKLVKTVSL